MKRLFLVILALVSVPVGVGVLYLALAVGGEYDLSGWQILAIIVSVLALVYLLARVIEKRFK